MVHARIHEGIRLMHFENVLSHTERSELSQMEAAELLGISEGTFRRWRDRHHESGAQGLADRRPSGGSNLLPDRDGPIDAQAEQHPETPQG
jgi:hypothetical protein